MNTTSFAPEGDPYSEVFSRIDPEQIRRWEAISEIGKGPAPAVLDTSCVRTGLHYQLANGRAPASLWAAQSGRIRLFMERETIHETWRKLPVFAQQLSVEAAELKRLFANEWLPHIRGVSLPDDVRTLDQRAIAVQERDPDDYPTAALAALLSPCILLTHNHKHFAPLNVQVRSQGVDTLIAMLDVRVGETHVQAVAMIPAAPVVAVGATTKWAAEKIGPLAWVLLVVIVVGGVVLYQQQPPERKEKIKHVAKETGQFLMDEYSRAANEVNNAHERLGAGLIPAPEDRSPAAAIVRKLALSDESMSAQQICDALEEEEMRLAVAPLRSWLHANKTEFFREIRRGSFDLGFTYAVHNTV